MKTISFNSNLEFGDKSSIKKASIKQETWKKISIEDLSKMTVGLLARNFRLVLQIAIDYDGPRRLWITTHEEDFEAIRSKYPQDVTLNATQILKLGENLETENKLDVMMSAAVLGAEVM